VVLPVPYNVGLVVFVPSNFHVVSDGVPVLETVIKKHTLFECA